MSALLARMLCACMLLGSVTSVGAQQSAASSADSLTLREAIVRALQRNPGLASFSFSLRAQEARIDGAGLKPAPEFSAELENVLGTGAVSGLSGADATFALSQVIELGDKRPARLALARSGRDVIDVDRAAAQLDVVAEVGRRFIKVARAQRQVEWAGRGVDLARETVSAAQRRVDAARSPEVELVRARVDLTRAELAARDAAQQLQSARRQLAAMWGDAEAGFATVAADLFLLPRPAGFDALMTRLEATPDFTRFATEARLRDAEVRLAEARRRPDVRWSAGVRRLQETRDQAFVVGFSVPLHSARQAAPAIAEARALRQQVEVEREAAFVLARAQLQDLHESLQYAIDEATVLEREVIPQMQQALRDVEYAYERGRYGYVELLDAQRALLDAEIAHIDAAGRAQELHNEIERLAAAPLARESWETTQP